MGDSTPLTVTISDACDNPIRHVEALFTTSLGTLDGREAVTKTTDAQGSATVTLSSAEAGVAIVMATIVEDPVYSGSGGTTVVFTPGPPYTVTLEAEPTSLIVGETSTLTATVVDEYTNPVSGQEVVFETDLGSLGSTGITETADANGVATATLSSTVAGTAHVTATSGLASDSKVVTFTHGPVASVELTPDPGTVWMGACMTYTLMAYDAYSNTWDVTEDATFTTDPWAGGTWTGNEYCTEYYGLWTVTGTYDTLSDTATLIVPYP